MVLGDLTSWSLTHFEPVRCWSAAEELTPTEVQEGRGLIGRTGRMSGSDYPENQMDTVTLRGGQSQGTRRCALDRSRPDGDFPHRGLGSSIRRFHPGSATCAPLKSGSRESSLASEPPDTLAQRISAPPGGIDVDALERNLG